MISRRVLRNAALLLCLLATASCTRTLADSGDPQSPASAATATVTEVASSPTVAAGAAANCLDDARFLEDLTVPDGSAVAPGQRVDKRWAMENTGDCDWGPDYRLVPLADNPLAGGAKAALYPARAGARAVWSVEFEAPEEPGEYIGQWVAVNPAGESFGSPVFTLIVVEEGAG